MPKSRSGASSGRSNCSVCGQSFGKPEHRVRHERTHSGDRPYACDEPNCGKAFARQDTLTRHQRLHVRPDPEPREMRRRSSSKEYVEVVDKGVNVVPIVPIPLSLPHASPVPQTPWELAQPMWQEAAHWPTGRRWSFSTQAPFQLPQTPPTPFSAPLPTIPLPPVFEDFSFNMPRVPTPAQQSALSPHQHSHQAFSPNTAYDLPTPSTSMTVFNDLSSPDSMTSGSTAPDTVYSEQSSFTSGGLELDLGLEAAEFRADLEQALRCHPDHAAALSQLGNLLNRRYGDGSTPTSTWPMPKDFHQTDKNELSRRVAGFRRSSMASYFDER